MTTHAHDVAPARRSSRPRWLLPALIAGGIAVTLVLAGFLSLATVAYAGLFGGMMLMHLGGHGGHGGPGATGRGHAAHPSEADGEPSADDERSPIEATDRRGGCH